MSIGQTSANGQSSLNCSSRHYSELIEMVKLDKTHSGGWSKGGEVYPQAPPPFIGG